MSVKCQIKSSGLLEKSDSYHVEYGTPQGSCLGPLLFLMFNNDLHRVLDSCHCILFADDTTIYFTHENMNFLEWTVNEDLKLVADWFHANKLTLNIKKTVCMLFTCKNTSKSLNIEIDSVKVPLVNHTKFLGLWLDLKLQWNIHTNNLLVKLKRNFNMLKEGQSFLDKHTLEILYYAQIYSHLSYGISLWGNHATNHTLDKLQKIQNKCLRIILCKSEINNKDFNKIKLLRINDIIKLENVKFAYKINNNLLPEEIMKSVTTDHSGTCLKKTH